MLIPAIKDFLSKKYGRKITEKDVFEMEYKSRDVQSPEEIAKMPLRLLPRDVRIATGRYRTREEHEKWREKVLSTPLP